LSHPDGVTTNVDGDLYDPEGVLAAAARTLDFERPIGLMLMGVLGHVADFDQARAIVRTLLAGLPSGSYLVSCDSTNVVDGAALDAAARIWNQSAKPPYRLRTPEQIAQFFDGLELLEPGVVSCPAWRPDEFEIGKIVEVDQFGAVGRKP
jgi:hypothetical protein